MKVQSQPIHNQSHLIKDFIEYGSINLDYCNETLECNTKEITAINHRLKDAEGNPNFYRNKKMINIALAVVTFAATVLACVCLLPILVKAFGTAITGYSPSGMAAGGILMMMFALPIGGYTAAKNLLNKSKNTAERDRSTLSHLTKENQKLQTIKSIGATSIKESAQQNADQINAGQEWRRTLIGAIRA